MKFTNVKNLIFISIICGALIACTNTQYASRSVELNYPGKTWMTKHPEEMGWSSKKLDLAQNYFSTIGATGVVVVDNGYVVAEWGDTKRRINCHSVRKSFLSALYGIFEHEGKIDISATLAELKIDDRQSLSEQEKQAKVSDLLKARSGVYHPAAYETTSMKKWRPERGSHAPGKFWYYNNWDFNALGTVFEQQTSVKIFDAFYNRIAQPIGMEDFRVSDGKYVKESVSIHPAYPFWMSARDRARFGLLYLRNGIWKGQQIIPQKWIEDSTKSYSQFGYAQIGYGYMWWVSTGSWHLGNKVRGKAYSARGYWGQYIVVLPAYNLVIVQVSDMSRGGRDVSGEKFNQLLKLILAARKKS